MSIDKEKLKAAAEATVGFDDLRLAPDVLLDLLDEIESLRSTLKYIRDCTDDWHVSDKADAALAESKETP